MNQTTWWQAVKNMAKSIALETLLRIYEGRMGEDFSTYTSHRLDAVNFLRQSS